MALYKQDMNKGYYCIITKNFKLASSKKNTYTFCKKIINLILNKSPLNHYLKSKISLIIHKENQKENDIYKLLFNQY